jgi:hypothetical protein
VISKKLILFIVLMIITIGVTTFIQNLDKEPTIFEISEGNSPLTIYSPVGDYEATFIITLDSTNGSVSLKYQDWDVYTERSIIIGKNEFTLTTDEADLVLISGTSAFGSYEIIEHGRAKDLMMIWFSIPLIFLLLITLVYLITTNIPKFKDFFYNRNENDEFIYKFGLLLINLTILLPLTGYRNMVPYIFNFFTILDNPPHIGILVDFSMITIYLYPIIITGVNIAVIIILNRHKLNNQALYTPVNYFLLIMGLLTIITALIAFQESKIFVGELLLIDYIHLITYGMLFLGGILISEHVTRGSNRNFYNRQ